MNKQFFETTLAYNWDMSSIEHKLDPVKVHAYVKKLTDPCKSFVFEVINNTTYVKYPEFKTQLLQSVIKFCITIGASPFYIFLPDNKVGSEH